MPTFRELADALPHTGSDTPLAALFDGITQPAKPPTGFIEPTLTIRDGRLEGSSAVLVAAPAAVGKSWFAEAVAADCSAPLWNLGRFPVGSGTFLGIVTATHGIPALAGVTHALSEGKYCVVLDALDEGYSLSRSDNFEAFISDLATQITALAPAGIAFVACGRTPTVDLTALLLSEAGLTPCVMALDFFSVDAANAFVDVQLDTEDRRGRRHTAHRQFRGPFENARDAIFGRVRTAVGGDDNATGIDPRSFLGYAPVLVALAGYLRVGDYQKLAQSLAAGLPSSSVQVQSENLWQFLDGIMIDLLRREQPKLIDHLPAQVRDGIEKSQLERLYSPEEQCAWLLARAAGTTAPFVDVPADILPEYEKSVMATLDEHPFVGAGPEGFASVVFRDYVISRALALDGGADAARTLARSRPYRPSPLLVRFFLTHVQSQQAPRIEPGDLEVLYASAQADEVGDAGTGLTVEQNAEGGLSIEIITARGDLLEFNMPESGDAILTLGDLVSHADVSAPKWTVIVGCVGREAVVGPGVTIECKRLRVASASLRIEGNDADDDVTWRVDSVTHTAGEFGLSGATRQRLRIIASEMPGYPWSSFIAYSDADTVSNDEALERAIRELKKLVTRFKPGPVSGNHPALPISIVNVLVARGRVSRDMYDYGRKTGLITVTGRVCLLHPQQFGMNIVDLKERRATPAVQDFLAEYVEAHGS